MRPYQDLRVIDLSFELGSYAARLFADLGAEVIRVEPLHASERNRPPLVDNEPGRSIFFEYLNLNKRSVTLDYRMPEGKAVLSDLVRSAAVVIYEACPDREDLLPLLQAVPGERVITVVSYFGLEGPYSGYRGSDLIAQAAGGIAWLTGSTKGPPLRLAGGQSIFVTSLYAASATAIALWATERDGGGHLLDVSAQECIAHSLQNATQVYDLEGRVTRRGGEGIRDATENIFACKDGYIFLAAPLQIPATWKALVEWLGEAGVAGGDELRGPDWADRRLRASAEFHARFRQIFEAFTAGKTKRELRDEALARRVILAPVSSFADTLEDPQLVHRKFFRTVHSPELGRDFVIPGAPYLLSEPVWSIARTAPAAGEGNALLGQVAVNS